jgi:hypothetical protein
MRGGRHGVDVHHGDEAENQEWWQEPKIMFPLPEASNVKVIL